MAQDGAISAPQGRQVYTPEFFAAFAPRTALDLLKQVPGFVVVAEDKARGLGEATGNVLINGERLSSKADSAEDQLSRIPAGNVIRIEIVDGASIDIAGLAGRVANIIVSTGTIGGQFQWDTLPPTKYGDGAWLAGKVSVSGATGPVEYTVALANSPRRTGTRGPSYFTDTEGNLLRERTGGTWGKVDAPKLSGTFKLDGPGSSIGNLNLSYQWNRVIHTENYDNFFPGTPPESFTAVRTSDRGHTFEIGGDLEFGFGPGRLKLIGLDRYKHSDFSTQSVNTFEDARPPAGNRFALLADSGERIARAEYRWRMAGGDWQLSGEAAFNRLDNVAGLFAVDPAGDFFEIPFPEGTGGVREDRYEATLSHSRALTRNLTLQLGLGAEHSTIAQTGPNAEQRSFQRPKGAVMLAWNPQPGLDVSLELRRAVGQLDFADFLAEVNLEDNNANAGNNQLVPQQSWEAELEIAKDFGHWGSATLTLFEHRIQDYVTIVPLPGGVESNGNVDKATARGVKLVGTLNLDPLGIAGAKIDTKIELQHSRLIDPVTGERRPFDLSKPHNVSVNFRHDIPRSHIAWGLEYMATKYAPYYRLAEYGFDYDLGQYGRVFIEHKNVFGLTVRAAAGNLLDGRHYLYRTVHTGPRSTSPVAYIEDRDHEIGPVWTIMVKGNF